MRRKTASIGEAGSSKVYCVYNQEDGIFEIVDARNQPLGGSCRLVDFDEFVEPNPKTWRSRLRAVVEWVFTDLLGRLCLMLGFDEPASVLHDVSVRRSYREIEDPLDAA